MGDRLGHVVDVAGKDPKERAYRNSTELALHTDACDAVAMLCLQKAARGRASGFTSGQRNAVKWVIISDLWYKVRSGA